ncbi:MAG: hypothetical protein HZA62_07645, partial [Rhodocyclales bacterium]|nr:hypothetical protein [Rhodocyclales bacterium]
DAINTQSSGAGTLNATAGSGGIFLDEADAAIIGTVTTTGAGNIKMSGGGSLSLGAITTGAGGYLDVTAGGAISQTGLLTIGGNLWVKSTGGSITLNGFTNLLGGTVSLTAPLSNGVSGAGSEVLIRANSIRIGLVRPSDSSTTDSGITAARVTIEAPSGGATILADGTQGLITADQPNGTTPALTIIADGVIGNPATASPTTEGLWVLTSGLVKVVADTLGAGTIMLFGDNAVQPKYEFSGDPTKRSVKYNGVEATNAQLTGALDAAYLDIRNMTTEIRESGFAKENASKVLRRGVVTSAGPGQPAVDDSTGMAGAEECEGGFANESLTCQ